MTADVSQTLEISQEGQETGEVREAHSTRHSFDNSPSKTVPLSTAHRNRSSARPKYHTAFMQCRSCCNCNAQCSYYGKGNFDSMGKYVGS